MQSQHDWSQGPSFDPFDALGLFPSQPFFHPVVIDTAFFWTAVTKIKIAQWANIDVPYTFGQAMLARDYFAHGQLHRLRMSGETGIVALYLSIAASIQHTHPTIETSNQNCKNT